MHATKIHKRIHKIYTKMQARFWVIWDSELVIQAGYSWTSSCRSGWPPGETTLINFSWATSKPRLPLGTIKLPNDSGLSGWHASAVARRRVNRADRPRCRAAAAWSFQFQTDEQFWLLSTTSVDSAVNHDGNDGLNVSMMLITTASDRRDRDIMPERTVTADTELHSAGTSSGGHGRIHSLPVPVTVHGSCSYKNFEASLTVDTSHLELKPE